MLQVNWGAIQLRIPRTGCLACLVCSAHLLSARAGVATRSSAPSSALRRPQDAPQLIGRCAPIQLGSISAAHFRDWLPSLLGILRQPPGCLRWRRAALERPLKRPQDALQLNGSTCPNQLGSILAAHFRDWLPILLGMLRPPPGCPRWRRAALKRPLKRPQTPSSALSSAPVCHAQVGRMRRHREGLGMEVKWLGS